MNEDISARARQVVFLLQPVVVVADVRCLLGVKQFFAARLLRVNLLLPGSHCSCRHTIQLDADTSRLVASKMQVTSSPRWYVPL